MPPHDAERRPRAGATRAARRAAPEHPACQLSAERGDDAHLVDPLLAVMTRTLPETALELAATDPQQDSAALVFRGTSPPRTAAQSHSPVRSGAS